jgi:hypothetical protein
MVGFIIKFIAAFFFQTHISSITTCNNENIDIIAVFTLSRWPYPEDTPSPTQPKSIDVKRAWVTMGYIVIKYKIDTTN